MKETMKDYEDVKLQV